MNTIDDMERLTRLAPAAGRRDPATDERLSSIRQLTAARIQTHEDPRDIVDARVGAPVGVSAGGPWRRRAVLVGVAAAAALVIPVAVNVVSPSSPLGQAGSLSAVAEDGRLECGTGYAEAIDPARAQPRYLPATLPDGLNLVRVYARDETGRGWCVPPSLTALSTGTDERVDGTLKVFGPFDVSLDDRGLGDATRSTVGGHEARLFTSDPTGTGTEQLHRWFWTDDSGRTWTAEVEGYPMERAARVVDGLDTTGDRVSWDGSQDPDLTVVHERSTAPYDVETHRQSWYVDVSDGRSQFPVIVDQRLDNHTTAPLIATAPLGARLTTLDGRDVLQMPASGSYDSDGDGKNDMPPSALVMMELAPGVRAMATASTAELSTQLLQELELVSADDPRLDDYGDL